MFYGIHESTPLEINRKWGSVVPRQHGPVERPELTGAVLGWGDVVAAAASPAGAVRLEYLRAHSAEWDWYL